MGDDTDLELGRLDMAPLCPEDGCQEELDVSYDDEAGYGEVYCPIHGVVQVL